MIFPTQGPNLSFLHLPHWEADSLSLNHLGQEPGRAPPRHAHGDLTSLAPHERLPEILVVPRVKLQYFGHLMRRVDSLEKTLILGRIEGRRRRGQQRMRWLDGITDSSCRLWGHKGSDMTWRQNNTTTLNEIRWLIKGYSVQMNMSP